MIQDIIEEHLKTVSELSSRLRKRLWENLENVLELAEKYVNICTSIYVCTCDC